MDIKVTFDASNFVDSLSKLQDKVKAGVQAAAIYFLSVSAREIKDGGDGWAPFKRPPKKPHQLLYDTGRLIGSLAPGGAMNELESINGGLGMQVGSNLAYARAQNAGDPSHHLPARPFIFFDDSRTAAMAEIIEKYINGA